MIISHESLKSQVTFNDSYNLQNQTGVVYNSQVILLIFQIIVALSLITAIVIQNQGKGLAGGVGGGEMYRSKRSFEKLLQRATIALTVIFALLSVVLLFHH